MDAQRAQMKQIRDAENAKLMTILNDQQNCPSYFKRNYYNDPQGNRDYSKFDIWTQPLVNHSNVCS